MAKVLVGGISVALAMNDGRISPNDLASKYIPAWRTDPLKSKITIRQLATHTSASGSLVKPTRGFIIVPGNAATLGVQESRQSLSIAILLRGCVLRPIERRLFVIGQALAFVKHAGDIVLGNRIPAVRQREQIFDRIVILAMKRLLTLMGAGKECCQ